MSIDGARTEIKDWVRLVSWLDGGRGMIAVEKDCSGVCLVIVEKDCSGVCLVIAVATSSLVVEGTGLLFGLFLRTSLVPSSWNLYRN